MPDETQEPTRLIVYLSEGASAAALTAAIHALDGVHQVATYHEGPVTIRNAVAYDVGPTRRTYL